MADARMEKSDLDKSPTKVQRRKSSLSTLTSSLSRASTKSGMSRIFNSRYSNASSSWVEDTFLEEGDSCETISAATVRVEESLESDILGELPVGASLVILEVGEGRRAKMSSRSFTGWISVRTKTNEPLVAKRRKDLALALEDFVPNCQIQVKSIVSVRATEELNSQVLADLRPGHTVNIVETSESNKRRAKVYSDTVEGWISLATRQGELLVVKALSLETTSNRSSTASMVLPFQGSSSKIKNLLEAARAGDVHAIRRVVEGSGLMSRIGVSNRPSLNVSDVRGKTALIYAAAFGNRDVVKYLLELSSEVDVNYVDDTKKSALHHASKRARRIEGAAADMSQADIVRMLIEAGSLIEARDHNGCTALMFAVANGEHGVAKALVEASANVNVRDFEGHTPLDYASNLGHPELANFLRSEGAIGESLESDEEVCYDAIEDDERRASVELRSASVAEDIDEQVASPQVASKKKAKRKSRTSQVGNADCCVEPGDGDTTLPSPDVKAKRPVTKKKTKTKANAKGEKKQPMKLAVEMAATNSEDKAAMEIQVVDNVAEVDEEMQARSKLQAVMQSTVSPDELSCAIQVAVAAGVRQEDVERAKQRCDELSQRMQSLQRLMLAIEEREVEKLHEAISRALSNEVPQTEIDRARAVLAEEEPKQEARNQLSEAQRKGDSQILRAALEMARVAGLDEDELVVFEDLLEGAESKEKAEAALRKAIGDRDVPQLRFALAQAREAGISPDDLCKAEEVLRVEEPKLKARKQIAEVCRTEQLDIADIRSAIQTGREVGLEEEELRKAEAILRREEEKQRLLHTVCGVLEEVSTVDVSCLQALQDAKQKLSSAIESAKDGGVSEAALGKAELRRRKIHNSVEDLKGSIRVFCRVRPLTPKECDAGDHQILEKVDLMNIKVKDPNAAYEFQFDAVFDPGTQEEIFDDCRDLVQSAADGYNVTLFAYGQTGAGKTFTMAGTPNEPGVAPRTIQEIYRVIDKGKDRFNYTVMASMLELYRNELVDLLVKGKALQKLNLRQDKAGLIIVEGLTEECCKDARELEIVLERGNQMRTVAATAMNSESSRSHLILIIKIVSVNRQTKEQITGKVLICDLAGSERLKKSQVTADNQKEAIEINKSLTALGDVIEALTKSQKQIPYRNHKLTQLMQDSIGGTAKTLMFVNCSPANSNLDETVNSLKYASRAKRITNNHRKSYLPQLPSE